MKQQTPVTFRAGAGNVENDLALWGRYKLTDGNCQMQTVLRAALYVDGYNLYHPIKEMNEPHLKWISLWKLGEIICKPHDAKLVKVVFCTAIPQHLEESKARHTTFNSAQRANGVLIVNGHHVHDGQKYNEKQSDINVALHLMMDAVDNVFEMAIILSADSDQAATAKMFGERFPQKRLLGVAPPGKNVPQKMLQHCFQHFSLSKSTIERCVMPEAVDGKHGRIMRPDAYTPPNDWVHPDDRPQGKPPKSPKKAAWSKGVRG